MSHWSLYFEWCWNSSIQILYLVQWNQIFIEPKWLMPYTYNGKAESWSGCFPGHTWYFFAGKVFLTWVSSSLVLASHNLLVTFNAGLRSEPSDAAVTTPDIFKNKGLLLFLFMCSAFPSLWCLGSWRDNVFQVLHDIPGVIHTQQNILLSWLWWM